MQWDRAAKDLHNPKRAGEILAEYAWRILIPTNAGKTGHKDRAELHDRDCSHGARLCPGSPRANLAPHARILLASAPRRLHLVGATNHCSRAELARGSALRIPPTFMPWRWARRAQAGCGQDTENFHVAALSPESTCWLRGCMLALQPGARPTSRGAGRQAARLSLMLSSAGGASLTRPPIAIILPSDTDRSESCPTCRAPNDTVLWCSRSSVDTV